MVTLVVCINLQTYTQGRGKKLIIVKWPMTDTLVESFLSNRSVLKPPDAHPI